MPGDVKSQFADLADKVSKGSVDVTKSLTNMVDATVKADKAHGHLTKTQESALKIEKQYQKSVQSLGKGLSSINASVLKTTSVFDSLGKVGGASAKQAERAYDNLGSKITKYEENLNAVKAAYKKASAEAAKSKLGKVDDKPLKKMESVLKRLKDLQKEGASKLKLVVDLDVGPISQAIQGVSNDILELKNSLDSIDDVEIIDKKIFQAQLDVIKDGWKHLSKTQKQMLLTAAASGTLDVAVGKLAQGNNALGIKLNQASKKAEETAVSYQTLAQEVKKVTKVSDLLKQEFVEGRREAESFAKGLGLTQSKSIAAGVAAFFLFKKAAELIEKFQQARMSIAKYNVELGKMGKTVPGTDTKQLEEYRNQLNLTRDQAKDFYNVLREGAQSGILSVGELVNAASQLQDAFGGDQTARLKEYVDLLNEIPTLDTDLKVSASLDKQSASLFALAQKGKISAVIELQQAGLAGGEQAEALAPDVELLNTAQKTEKTMDNINSFLTTKLFPSWGPQFSMIAGYTFKTFSAIGGFAAVSGTLQAMMLKRQSGTTRAVNAVERAIRMGRGKGGRGGRGTRTLERGIFNAFKKSFKMSMVRRGGFAKAGVKGLVLALKSASLKTFTTSLLPAIKNIKTFGSGILQVAKGALVKFGKTALTAAKSIAGIGAIVGAVLGVAGLAADWYAGKLEASGDKTGAAVAKLGGTALSAAGTIAGMAATGAILGSWFPVLGTALGAAVGAIAGLAIVMVDQTGAIGDAMTNLGKELQNKTQVGGASVDKYKFSPAMAKFGKWLESAGPIVSEFGKVIKQGATDALGYLWKGVKWVGKAIWDWGTPIGLATQAIKAFASALETDEYKAAFKKNAEEVKQSSAVWEATQKKNKLISAKMAEAQSKVMKSALGMERQMKATASIVNNANMAFADFRKELGGLEMSIYREIGGSAERFREAADSSAKGISDRFDEVQDGLRQRRQQIIKDGSLDAESRRMALMNLHNEEMKAVQLFVQGMGKLINEVVESGETMKQGLQMKIKEGQLDFSKDMGGFMTGPEVFDRLGANMKDGSALIKETFEGLAQSEELMQTRREMMANREKGMNKDAVDAFNSLPGNLKQTLGTAFKTKTEKGPGGETTKVTDVNVEEAKKVKKGLSVELEKLRMEYNASAKIIEAGNWGELAKNMNGVTEATKKLDEEQKIITKLAESAKDDLNKRDEAVKKQKELDEKRKGLYQAQADSQEKLSNIMMQNVDNDVEAADLLSKMVAAGSISVKLTDQELKVRDKAVAGFMKLGNGQDKVLKELANQARNSGRRNQLEKALAVADMATGDEITLANAELDNTLKNQQKMQENAKMLAANIDRYATAAADITASERRVLESRKAEMVMAIQSGNALSNIAEISASNVDIYKKSVKANEEALVGLDKEEAAYKESLAAATTKEQKDVFRGLITRVEETRKNIKTAQSELAQTLVDMIEGLDDTITAAMKQPIGKKVGFDLDLTEAGFELAQFSEAAMASVGDMVTLGKEAAKKRRNIEKESLDIWVQNATAAAREMADKASAQMMKPVAEGGKGMDAEKAKAAGEALYSAQMETVESQKKLQIARSEKDEKQKVLDLAEKATRLQMDQLDVAQGSVDIQKDLFESFGGSALELTNMLGKELGIEKKKLNALKSQAAEARAIDANSLATKKLELEVSKKQAEVRKKEYDIVKQGLSFRSDALGMEKELLQAQLDMGMDFGSSLSAVMGMQQQMVGIARQEYELKKEAYDAAVKAGEDGNVLRKKQVEMAIAEMNVKRQSMGVQRDIMEKMIGSALGQTRTSVGARRRRGTDTGIIGYEGSRVKTRSGLLTGAGPGGVKTIAQRVAGLKGAAQGPKRLKPEEKMAEELRKTAKATDETATATDKTASATKATADSVSKGDTPGSFYTHDTTAEGLLASILYVAQEIAVGIDDQIKGMEVISTTSGSSKKESVRDKLAKGIAEAQKNVPKTVEPPAPAPVSSAVAKAGSDIANISDKADKEVVVEKKAFKQDKEASKARTGLKKEIHGNLGQLRKDMVNYKVVSSGTLSGLSKNLKEGGYLASTDVTQGLGALLDEVDSSGKFQISTLDNLEKAMRDVDGSVQSTGSEQLAIGQKQVDLQNKAVESNKKLAQGKGLGGGLKGSGFTTPSRVKTMEQTLTMGLKGKGKMMGGSGKGSGRDKYDSGAVAAKSKTKNFDKKLGSISLVNMEDTVETAAESAKKTTADVINIASKSVSRSPVGGGIGIQEAKPPIAASAVSAAQPTTPSMSFEGKISVQFNNALFQDQVTTIALKAMKLPEGQKAIFSGA